MIIVFTSQDSLSGNDSQNARRIAIAEMIIRIKAVETTNSK